MKTVYTLVGALVGWVFLSVGTGIVLGLLVYSTGLDQRVELYGVGVGALVGIVWGGAVGRLAGKEKELRGATDRATAKLAAAVPQRSTAAEGRPLSQRETVDTNVTKRLDELDLLHSSGRITQAEHQDLRTKLLSSHFVQWSRSGTADETGHS